MLQKVYGGVFINSEWSIQMNEDFKRLYGEADIVLVSRKADRNGSAMLSGCPITEYQKKRSLCGHPRGANYKACHLRWSIDAESNMQKAVVCRRQEVEIRKNCTLF